MAALAVISNWLVLHRIVGRRVSRHERGFDAGIVLYPLAVLVLIVVFRDRLAIAGASWAIMAFGDGFATLAGKNIRGPRLPWNEEKTGADSLAFLAFGFVGRRGRVALHRRQRAADDHRPDRVPLRDRGVVAAERRRQPGRAARRRIAFSMLLAMRHMPMPQFDVTWLIVNTVLALLGYAMKSVDLSGLIGGWLLGAIILVFGGWKLYLVLLAFFVVGTLMTKVGYRGKARSGWRRRRGTPRRVARLLERRRRRDTRAGLRGDRSGVGRALARRRGVAGDRGRGHDRVRGRSAHRTANFSAVDAEACAGRYRGGDLDRGNARRNHRGAARGAGRDPRSEDVVLLTWRRSSGRTSRALPEAGTANSRGASPTAR